VRSVKLSCFKAYDIRGRIPDELNEDLAYRIGQAYTRLRQAEARGGRSRHPPLERAAVEAR
jgi:phosphomannomutase